MGTLTIFQSARLQYNRATLCPYRRLISGRGDIERVGKSAIFITEIGEQPSTGREQRTEKSTVFHQLRARTIVVTKYSFGTSTAASTI
jgi:hypothetical protein